MNRKLIRPNLSEIKEKIHQEKINQQQDASKKKVHPPYDTHAENYYFLKQMNKKTKMAIVLKDGEVIEGFVEWYDRHCIKLNRDEAPNLLIYKNNVKYIYKLNEPKEESELKKK